MYWNKESETPQRESLERLQLQRLNSTLEKAMQAPFYRDSLGRNGFRRLSSLREVSQLPFTTKADLRNAFPYGFLAVPLENIVRLHSSSGTTGNPTVIYHTREDIETWQDLVARCMYMTGMRSTDVFQNMRGYGLFTGGLGFHYGAEKLGAMTIPIGPGNSRRQIWFMREFGTTVIHVLPSYALRLATHVRELGLDPRKDFKLRMAYVGAEPHTEETRRRIEETWGIKAYNSYGLSEMCGPGVAFECTEQSGMHIWEDQFLAEIVDPETGANLPEGECGELVLSSIGRAGTPLLRFRTRDLTRFLSGPCPCGRTHRRIDRIQGRSDDMMIINGVNIFPMQIEQTLMRISGIGANYQIEIHEDNYMDKLHVRVELAPETFAGTLGQVEGLQGKVCAALKEETGVTPVVKLLEAGSLPAAEGKAVRVVDLRKQPRREC